jgi:4-amino-4-deoxy-L-arabinose transferase-like glycosyltransferase
MTTIYLAIALFGVSAVLGLAILIKWMNRKSASWGVIYSHGLVAAAALVALVVFAIQNPGNYPQVALALFVLSAVVGFYMFFRDLSKKMSPLGLAVAHGLVAVSGFIALLVYVFV